MEKGDGVILFFYWGFLIFLNVCIRVFLLLWVFFFIFVFIGDVFHVRVFSLWVFFLFHIRDVFLEVCNEKYFS